MSLHKATRDKIQVGDTVLIPHMGWGGYDKVTVVRQTAAFSILSNGLRINKDGRETSRYAGMYRRHIYLWDAAGQAAWDDYQVERATKILRHKLADTKWSTISVSTCQRIADLIDAELSIAK